jgi:hypothetical protein
VINAVLSFMQERAPSCRCRQRRSEGGDDPVARAHGRGLADAFAESHTQSLTYRHPQVGVVNDRTPAQNLNCPATASHKVDHDNDQR